MALMLLLILIQVVGVTALAIYLCIQYPPFIIEFILIDIIVLLIVINRKGNADLKLPWVLIILILPIFGMLIYVFFGNHGLKPRYRRIIRQINNSNKQYFPLAWLSPNTRL